MLRIKVLIVFLVNVPLVSLVKLDLIECGVDNQMSVSQGDVEITQYPWLGVLYYSYFGDVGETRAVTTVTLIQKEFVIAVAADIGPMPKHDFRKNSLVLLGQRWNDRGRRVRNYLLHPEYGATLNTVALIQLKDPIHNNVIRPVCAPPELLRDPIFYVMRFKDDYNDLQKQVLPVAHIPSNMCKEFYVRANLYSKQMRPPHVACAVSLDEDTPCVWNAGAALVSRDVWGRWQLLGVGVRGPGCGAPARFLDMGSYYPWIESSLQQFKRITISKITKQKYVLRMAGGVTQKFGACDEEEKIYLVYREQIILKTDVTQYKFVTYNMTIRDNVDYTCLTLEIVNASAMSEMHVRHSCPRLPDGGPCHYYTGTVFDISVDLMFSDCCLFEMHAWGETKRMTLLDPQEWKWEEGTYYEDFFPERHEYRGPTFMTEFGYEPLDDKMWIPDYDMWTTTGTQGPTTSELPKTDESYGPLSYVYIPTIGTQPTKSTIKTRRRKKYFKRKNATTTTIPPTTTVSGSWWPFQG